MTLFRKYIKGFLAIGISLVGFYSFATGQVTAELQNNASDEVVIKVANINENKSPEKILLVYDSTLITLESLADNLTMSNRTSATMNYFSSMSSMEALLAEEMEKDQAVEKWMLKPFKTKTSFEEALITEEEEEAPIEDWMTDLSQW